MEINKQFEQTTMQVICNKHKASQEEVCVICSDPECKNHTLLCPLCIAEQHKGSHIILTLKQVLSNSPFQVYNWPLQQYLCKEPFTYYLNHQKIIEQLAQQQCSQNSLHQSQSQCQPEKDIEEIREIFKKIRKSINATLDSLEDKIIKQVTGIFQTNKPNLIELQKQLYESLKLDELKQILESYSQNKQDYEKTNPAIDKFFHQNQERDQKIKSVNDFFQQKILELQDYRILTNQELIEKHLSKHQEMLEEFGKEIVKIIDPAPKITFTQTTENSSNKIAFYGNKFKIPYSGSYTIVTSQPFNRNSQVYLKFRLNGDRKESRSQIFAGITLEEHKNGSFWFNSGNQTDFVYKHSKDTFQTTGVDLRDIYKSGNIYEIEVAVSANKLIVKDQENRSINQSQKQLENKDSWVVVLGAGNQEIEFEILESAIF